MFSFRINDFQSAYGRLSGVRSGFSTIGPVGRLLLMIAALPGILLAALSLLLFIVSILALLLLTAPVYRLLQMVRGMHAGEARFSESAPRLDPIDSPFDPDPSPGRKQVDVRVVEP